MPEKRDAEPTWELPSSSELRVRVMRADSLAALPAFAVVVFYLWALVGPSLAEWKAFSIAALIFGVLVFVICEPIRRRMSAPIALYLDRRRDAEAEPSEIRAAFHAVYSMPRGMALMSLIVWGAAAATVPLCMQLLGHAGWAGGMRLAVLVLAALSGAFVSSALNFFLVKHTLSQIGQLLAADLPDASERAALVVRVSLAQKLQYIIVGCAAATLAFGMALSYSRAHSAISDLASGWHANALEALAPSAQQGRFDDAIAEFWRGGLLLPYPTTFQLLESKNPQAVSLLALGSTGVRAGVGMEELLTWRSLSDGRVLTAETPCAALGAPLAGFGALLAMLMAVSSGLLWLVARGFANDIRRTTMTLGASVKKLREGDLRPAKLLESEDELGDLARQFDQMREELRQTLLRLSLAASEVDRVACGIETSTTTLIGSGAEQAGRIELASAMMTQINDQVAGIAESAQALNVSVEESSSSILELGAAGDELNETASVLSGKVDEVSSSIEEMVRSVKEVGTSADDLSEVASETSSSMEEMASAMRAVDTTAELAADLSREVVESSESGQAKVAQTIAGMQAIREATDAAEAVIQGLGARAKEIGTILDVIDDVADETNLLALNAAIIAAQAGEHGRAFSVVADEIKELADRVLVSTKEIGRLIGAVQEESANAIDAIERGSRSVAEGVDLSAQAGTSLEEITRASKDSGNRMSEIVSAVREQTKAATHVVMLMERVRGGVEQIGRAGEEQDRGHEVVYRSAVTMREVAQQVRRTTGEQSSGFGRIRESVEGVREAAEQINNALQEQSDATSRAMEFLEQVAEGTRAAESAGTELKVTQRALVQQADVLRHEVEKFRL